MLWSAPLVFWVFGGQNTRYWELIEESFSNSKWTETFTFEHLSVVIRGVFGGSCGFTWYCATCLHPHSINQNFWNKLPWYYDTVRIHPQFTQPINPHSINLLFVFRLSPWFISPWSTHTQLTQTFEILLLLHFILVWTFTTMILLHKQFCQFGLCQKPFADNTEYRGICTDVS